MLNSELNSDYTKMLSNLHGVDNSEWVKRFQDWNKMTLRDDIELYSDFVLVGQKAWQKLINFFGGAPEIGFNLIDKPISELTVPSVPDREIAKLSQPFHDLPDLKPIKIEACYSEGSPDARGF